MDALIFGKQVISSLKVFELQSVKSVKLDLCKKKNKKK